MGVRKYYSQRQNPAQRLDRTTFKSLFRSAYQDLETRGLFQEWLGTNCVDSTDPGKAGRDIDGFFLRRLRKNGLWPITDRLIRYSEDDLFDVIELLHDVASEGSDGSYHSFNECGWHYKSFDSEKGRLTFRTSMNEILRDYEDGFELSTEGEILQLGNDDMVDLMNEATSSGIDEIDSRVRAAKRKFRHRNSGTTEQRDSVRDLGDVLEFLRPKLSQVIAAKDQRDLFNLLNNFGIRHHNPEQQTEYDEGYLEALFYHFLNLINLAVRRLKDVERPE